MEENKENIVKYHQNKRKKQKIKLAKISIVLIVISIILMVIYHNLGKQDYIEYTETAEATYEVNLKENEFYEEPTLKEGMDVISSLIKNISAEFKYDLDLSEEIKYGYEYKILAEVEVKEKSKSNLLYNKEYEILNKIMQEVKNNKLDIIEKINIDYNKDNDETKKFLEIYDLRNTTSDLTVKLSLNVINQKNQEKINKQTDVAIITIPLTTNTTEITVNENIKNNQGEIKKEGIQYEIKEYILALGLILLIIGVMVFIKLLKYISETRSAEKMYDDELKRILFDYKSYIQKITNILDYNDYKIVNVDTFKELIGMREELQSPILMYTEPDSRRTTFLMVNQNLLFQYILDSNLIREKLIKISKEKKENKDEKNK